LLSSQASGTASLGVTNRSQGPVKLLRLAPLSVDPARGGVLLLGPDPRTHRILENGRFVAFDQTVQLEAGDVDRFSLATALPIPLRGNSVANWNHVVADLGTPSRSLVAGYLTFEHSIPTLGIGWDRKAEGFTTYAAESALLFHGKSIGPGETFSSELLYLDPLPDDPLAGLEQYATELAAFQHITPWPRRGPGHEVPNGWNSWTGGSGTGGYGPVIDAALITANMEVAKRELAPFGMTYFQVDDGWQVAHGDWQWNPQRFPEGGAAMAAQIRAAGFRPGLWIAPFLVDPTSQLASQHPDWLQPKEDGILGTFGKDHQTLDLSNPDARTFVHDTFAQIAADGFVWAKVDFAYFDLFGKPLADPSLTAIESWRGGWKEMRRALGPDVFLLGIGVMGTNIGVVDGMRLTNDNGPQWEEPDPDSVVGVPRAFKATVRTGTRRWFYQNRIWVNHNDLIFFRSWPDPAVPPLSLEESRAFATWIGLSGGVVKLGDKLVDLATHPEWIDIVRRLLPAWPDGTRPLDVLARDYPEQYRGHITAPAGEWDLVGLVNWGTNRDWAQNPPQALPEAQRTYTVHCEGECLVYEFWSEQFIGRKSGDFTFDVQPRRAVVLSLRQPTGTPQLLGTNRHITQGATDLGPVQWNAAAKRLEGSLEGSVGTPSAPWEYHLAFYAPTGFTLDHAEVDGVTAPAATQQGQVVTLRFSLAVAQQGQPVGFRVFFR
jgi:hypothetical protein